MLCGRSVASHHEDVSSTKESIHLISMSMSERDILHAYRKTESYVMEAQHQDRSYRGICMYTSGNFPSEPLQGHVLMVTDLLGKLILSQKA